MAFTATMKTKMAAFQQAWILRLTLRAVWSQSTADTLIPWASGSLPPGDPAMDGEARWGASVGALRNVGEDYTYPTFYVDPMTLRMPEQALDLSNWTCNGGQWSIEIVWNDSAALSWLVPGQLVELALGYTRCPHEDMARLAVGWLWSVSKLAQPGRYRLIVYDLMAIMNGDLPHQSYPFGDPFLAHSITTGHDYTAGDTELYVDSIVDFDASVDKGGVYTLVVTPDTGDPFILKASGRLADRFTGVTTVGQYGTTAADAAALNLVRVAYRLEGHPGEVLMRCLTSTGAGTNGTYDQEAGPVSYGMPEDLINAGDLATWIAALDPPSDPFAIDLPICDLGTTTSGARPTTLTEGLREIQRRLGQAAMWLAFRQGHYVLRGLQDLQDTPEVSGLTVTLGRVVPGAIVVEQYAAETAEEYAGVRVTTSEVGGSVSEDLPPRLLIRTFATDYPLDCTGMIWDDGAGGEIPDSIAARARDWVVNRLLRLKLTVSGLHWLQLCPGDLVDVDLSTGPTSGPDALDFAVRIADTTGTALTWPVTMMVERIQGMLPNPSVSLSLVLAPRRTGGEDEPGGTVPVLV